MSYPASPVVRNFATVKPEVVGRSRGATIQTLIGPADGAPHFTTRRFTLAAGGRIPRHRHANIEHEQWILSGSMVIGLDDREVGGGRAATASSFRPESPTGTRIERTNPSVSSA